MGCRHQGAFAKVCLRNTKQLNTRVFFVNKKQVIRTATDKGGGAFFQLASWLFVIDDMSGSHQNRVRAPWWDELAKKDASAVQINNQYVFTFFLEDANKFITFAIPEKNLNRLK